MSKSKKTVQKNNVPIILSSSKTMFITSTLLIAGLLFSSALLFYYRSSDLSLRPSAAKIKTTISEKAIYYGTNLWNMTEEKPTKKKAKKKKKEEPLPYSLSKYISSSADEKEVEALSIAGFGKSGNDADYVIIGGIRYFENETKNGVSVLKINQDRTVDVKYKGKTKTLKIGDNL